MEKISTKANTERMKIMRNKRQDFKETKWEKFLNNIKEKRFYIVLFCCIMALSATYFVLDSFQKAPSPQSRTEVPTKPSPTPLPDLTKNFPANDLESRATPFQTPKQDIAPMQKTNKNETAKPANAEGDTPYQAREKKALARPVEGNIINVYSDENLIYSKTLGDWRTHNGIDIETSIGTEVKASDDGIIYDVYADDFMGITIVIDHQNGLKTVYSNLSNSSLVKKGDSINRGDVISTVGDTAICESAEAEHLHFELYEDESLINPLLMLEK